MMLLYSLFQYLPALFCINVRVVVQSVNFKKERKGKKNEIKLNVHNGYNLRYKK